MASSTFGIFFHFSLGFVLLASNYGEGHFFYSDLPSWGAGADQSRNFFCPTQGSFAVKGDCNGFFNCYIDGRRPWPQSHCPYTKKYFHPVEKICTDDISVCDLCKNEGYNADPASRSGYIVCKDGNGEREECPNGQEIDLVLDHCVPLGTALNPKLRTTTTEPPEIDYASLYTTPPALIRYRNRWGGWAWLHSTGQHYYPPDDPTTTASAPSTPTPTTTTTRKPTTTKRATTKRTTTTTPPFRALDSVFLYGDGQGTTAQPQWGQWARWQWADEHSHADPGYRTGTGHDHPDFGRGWFNEPPPPFWGPPVAPWGASAEEEAHSHRDGSNS